jgi:hypothetical protein
LLEESQTTLIPIPPSPIGAHTVSGPLSVKARRGQ